MTLTARHAAYAHAPQVGDRSTSESSESLSFHQPLPLSLTSHRNCHLTTVRSHASPALVPPRRKFTNNPGVVYRYLQSETHCRGARVRPEPRCGAYTVTSDNLALSAERLCALLQTGSKHETRQTQILTGSPRSCADRPRHMGLRGLLDPKRLLGHMGPWARVRTGTRV